MNAQNAWLRSNVFDAMGNYLFCVKCVCAAFHVSPQRLSRLREVKRAQFQTPTVEMLKSEVEKERLSAYVLMPSSCDTCFAVWWRSLETSAAVTVRYPHERHGHSGKTSNSAKSDVQSDFLNFVDCNCQPNGRAAESHGPTHYFISKFTTIQTPKPGVSNYVQRLKRSVVGEFNRAQRAAGRKTCSNGSAYNWLRLYRPKVGICPHKQDYCDTCSKLKADIHAKQTTLNRRRQTGDATVEEQQFIESEIRKCEALLENHRDQARLSHEYYIEVTRRCKQEMEKITALEENSEANETELTTLKNKFTLTVSADYQMSKLIPFWGLSPQPGSTYYLQKLSHDVFGIVNHADNASAIYIFDERMGPKNTDHTVSYLSDYLCQSEKVPRWIQRLHIFLDNAGSTNKNFYLLGWANEMVQLGKFDFIRMSFLIAGHTKFAPDLLFSKVAQSFARSDVFNTAELAEIAGQYAFVVTDDGEKVKTWRDSLVKYSTLQGIRELHDFLFARNPGSDVRLRARPLCYTGAIQDTTFHVKRGYRLHDSAIPTESYKSTGLTRELSETKVSHLRQMSANFIPADRHLSFL